MARGKNFIICPGVYPFDIMVSFGQTDEQLAAALDQYDLPKEDEDLWKYPSDTVKGRAVSFSTNASLIRFRRLPENADDHSTIAHEVFHVTTFIMWRVGMQLKRSNDEAFAYLIGFITREIYKRI